MPQQFQEIMMASVSGVMERSPEYEAKRMDILRKAALTFAEEGYFQTSVSGLASSLGVSKPVLYYYAKNKDDLLYQCGEIARSELRQAIEHTSRLKVSGIGQLRRFFSRYAGIMCGEFGRCLALVDSRALNPESRKKDVAIRRELEEAVRLIIRQGQEDGSIGVCDPTLVGRALFGAFNGIPRWFNVEGPLTPEDVADGYLDVFLNGLRRP
jgi:AcrR family transcriptional regulator